MRGVLGVIVLGAIALFALMKFGGGASVRGPNRTPDINAPSVNEAADRANKGGNVAADEVSSWTPQTWKIIIILVIAAVIVIAWRKYAAFKWITTGIGIAILGFLIFI